MFEKFLILVGLKRARPGPRGLLGFLGRTILRSTPILGAFPFPIGGLLPVAAYEAWRARGRVRTRFVERRAHPALGM